MAKGHAALLFVCPFPAWLLLFVYGLYSRCLYPSAVGTIMAVWKTRGADGRLGQGEEDISPIFPQRKSKSR